MNLKGEKNNTPSVMNVLPDGIISLLPDGRIIHINIEAQQQLHINASSSEKYKSNRLYLSDLLSLVWQDEDILPKILQKLQRSEQGVELPHNICIQEKAMNTLFPIKGQFFTFESRKGVTEIVFYFHNITNELTQEYILNTALRRTRIYPWFLDIDRGVFVLDSRYFEYLGIPAGEGNTLTMEEYTNMVHPEDRQSLTDAFSIQFGGNTAYEKPVAFRLKRGDGNWEWFEGQSTYIGKLSGLPYRLVGICSSIQEHKNIEETLIKARNKAEESDRLKSAFLANMSHEIRTPLNAIVGFSDVLITNFEELSQKEREVYVSMIKENSAQLLVLISDILDLSKIESNTMEFNFSETSLNLILTEIYHVQKLNESPAVRLELQIPEQELNIVTDTMRIKQVINNLLNNALKFTSEGKVTIGFKRKEENAVQLFVEDTGEGIPQKHLGHIFERFYKVNSFKQGTGLGLSICKTIVECLQGSISVESEPGKGARFTVTLPVRTFKK